MLINISLGKRVSLTTCMVSLYLCLGCGQTRHLGARLKVEPPKSDVRKQQNEAWLKVIKERARDGYWLVVRGYHVTDHFVVAATNIPLSHAAVLDITGQQVIEAKSEGIIVTPLTQFVNQVHRVLLIKPQWWTEKRGREATQKAHALKGKGYDFTGLVGISSSDRFYCSELAFHVYKPFHQRRDHIPLVIEPGQMYLWGDLIWDSKTRD